MTSSRVTNSPNISEILKLIKMYIQFNPGCTAHDISLMFTREDYRIRNKLTTKSIRRIIMSHANNPHYPWFNIKIDKETLPMRLYCPFSKIWTEEFEEEEEDEERTS